jgi:glutamyl/glutaminyl-tRNA synthetase
VYLKGLLRWYVLQVTYSSDYFRELYELAVKLIKSGNAFVCHQTAEEISEYRQAFKNQSLLSLLHDFIFAYPCLYVVWGILVSHLD